MNIVIAGGSNSVARNGYLKHFVAEISNYFEDVNIENISVGGTTSLCMFGRIASLEFEPDLILLEYSLNDTGHINHLHGAAHKKRLLLDIFMFACKSYFPEARVLPVILASEPFYKIDVLNHVYDVELDYFHKHKITFIDMRRTMYEIFGENPPEFLYSDIAHFHYGAASAIIGKMVAQAARLAMANGISAQTIQGHSIEISNGRMVRPVYRSAVQIAENAGLSPEVLDIQNKLMKLKVLHMGIGTSLDISFDGWPICFYFASNVDHGPLRLSINDVSMTIATRHVDVVEGKFLYTSVPLLLHDNYMDNLDLNSRQFNISVEAADSVDFQFDCLGQNSGNDVHVRLVGFLGLKAANQQSGRCRGKV